MTKKWINWKSQFKHSESFGTKIGDSREASMSIIFLNFWHQFANLLQMEVFEMPTPLWTFSHALMINTLKRFPAISRWKGLDAQTNFATEWFLFSKLFSQKPSIQDESAICFLVWRLSKAKKNFTLILFWRKEISVLICFFFRPSSKKNEFLFFFRL